MNIVQEIKKLNFPKNQYVIVGSGTLSVLDIRPANDIDIAVTRNLYQNLLKINCWKHISKYGKIFLNNDNIEIIPELNWDKYKTTTEKAISTALVIEGIPFMNLDELCKFKTALGREKDLKDVELIKNYLKNKF